MPAAPTAGGGRAPALRATAHVQTAAQFARASSAMRRTRHSGVEDDREPGSAEGDLDGEIRGLAPGLANLDVLTRIPIDFVVWTNGGSQRVGDLLRDLVHAHSARDCNRDFAFAPALRLNSDAEKPIGARPLVDRKLGLVVESRRQRPALRQRRTG